MTACPKTKNYRDPHLLRMARGRDPVATLPNVYDDPSTTVAAHANWEMMGKGKGLKAHDFFIIYVGYWFHQWLDTSSAPKKEKIAVFWCAYKIQLEVWAQIASDHYTPQKDKQSAGNAINAFSEWVTENAWRFCEGDWQLDYMMEVV